MPIRLAALEERRQPLPTFRAHAQTCEQSCSFFTQAIAVGELRHSAYQLLRGAQRLRPATQQMVDLCRDCRIELLGASREVQEPDAPGFQRIERRRGEEQAPCVAIADRRNDIGRNGRRHDAEPHFRQCELRSLRGDCDVRARDEADTAAEYVAVDPRDDRFIELVERAQAADQQQGIVDVLLLGRAPAQKLAPAPVSTTTRT